MSVTLDARPSTTKCLNTVSLVKLPGSDLHASDARYALHLLHSLSRMLPRVHSWVAYLISQGKPICFLYIGFPQASVATPVSYASPSDKESTLPGPMLNARPIFHIALGPHDSSIYHAVFRDSVSNMRFPGPPESTCHHPTEKALVFAWAQRRTQASGAGSKGQR